MESKNDPIFTELSTVCGRQRVTRVEFSKDVTHKPLRPNPVKNPIVPSPEQEPEITADEGTEVGVDWQQFQQRPTTQADTGLTGASHRSNRWGPGQYGQQKKSTSPLCPFLNLIFGMCKSQYDIEVEQQWMRIERKKERDTMKHLHNHFGFQPPHSPISPTPPEVEIPMFDQRMRTLINSNMINEYGSMFFESGEGSSSSAASTAWFRGGPSALRCSSGTSSVPSSLQRPCCPTSTYG
jgi:hypothetical protein